MVLEEILARLAEGARQILQADAAMIRLLDTGGTELSAPAACGLPDELQQREPIALEESPLDQDALTKGIIVLEEAKDDPRAGRVPEDYCSVACIPLTHEGDSLGILHLYAAAPGCFGEEDTRLLAPLVDLGAEAIAARRALSKLEARETSRGRFIRIATHELRSPVTVAQSLIRNVLKGYAGDLTEQQSDIFDRVSRRLDFLESLVNDLLDLAAGKSPELTEEEQPVAINSSVGRAVLLIQPRAEETGVNVTLEPCCEELVVWGAHEGHDRIFVNLLENAVKYTPPGGAVDVLLGREGEEIRVVISDTGIGIPEDALPHLFEEFYRAPNAKEMDAVGTGLGLTIVKDLVDRYAGRIEVESEVGEGTAFTVAFPIHRVGG
ncbi:MAG: GAF domain-containing sensor histidine kinase [Anaerolineae bacterium]